eukprot:1727690-Prymnesium_polylepis.1
MGSKPPTGTGRPAACVRIGASVERVGVAMIKDRSPDHARPCTSDKAPRGLVSAPSARREGASGGA